MAQTPPRPPGFEAGFNQGEAEFMDNFNGHLDATNPSKGIENRKNPGEPIRGQ